MSSEIVKEITEDGEVYRLKAGETLSDDLYVFGREIIIDGTVDGDVIAFGGIIEINGAKSI